MTIFKTMQLEGGARMEDYFLGPYNTMLKKVKYNLTL